jgi:thioredoxin 1
MTDSTTAQAKKGAVHLSADDFDQTIQNAGMPVFVDFYAEWCAPCKMAAPIVEKLADEYTGRVLIAKLDTDEARAIAQKYGVMSIPTVLVFNKVGEEVKEVDRKIGFPGEAGYRQMLEKVAPASAATGK